MNAKQLKEFISQPDTLLQSETQQLSELVTLFPYCQTIQILHTKGLYNQDNFKFGQALKTAAAYAADRRLLFALMPPHSRKESLAQATAQLVAPIDTEPVNVEQKAETAPVNVPIHVPVESIVKEIPETAAKAVTEAHTPGAASEILEQRLAELRGETYIPKGLPTNETIESHTASEVEAVLKDIVEPIELYDITPILNKEFEHEAPLTEESTEITEPVPTPVSEDTSTHSFTQWLQAKPAEHSGPKPEQVSAERAQVKNEKLKLIENFIKKEPRIEPAKAQFYSPVNMARKSVTDSDEIVSETLAKVYSLQGNYPKAISVYEKLSLLFPEKSALFAAQIIELNKKLTE